jgi:hypothetical protein
VLTPKPALAPAPLPPQVREFYSGSNALGPYILSHWFLGIFYVHGAIILATMIYWLTGGCPSLYPAGSRPEAH